MTDTESIFIPSNWALEGKDGKRRLKGDMVERTHRTIETGRRTSCVSETEKQQLS